MHLEKIQAHSGCALHPIDKPHDILGEQLQYLNLTSIEPMSALSIIMESSKMLQNAH